jgi:hypothetical protein
MTQRLLNNRQRRWLEFLQEYDFEIEYLPCRDNVVADALSRRAYASTISVVRSNLRDLIIEALPTDAFFGEAYKALSGELAKEVMEKYGKYKMEDGMLFYEGRLCIPDVRHIQESILKYCYDIPIAGHPCFAKTYRHLHKSFFWPGIKSMVKDYVLGCEACQRTKAERVRTPGLLHPLDIPEMKWESVSLDFVTALPRVRGGFDSVLVVVDRFNQGSPLHTHKVNPYHNRHN